MYAFLVTLREGLEAALIIGILLAYLNKAGNQSGKRFVWFGTGISIGLSLLGGLLIHWFVGGLPGELMDLFEGGMMILATAILSGMLVLMQRNARNLKGSLNARLDRATADGSAWGLALLAFTVVGREGLETVLFLAGGAAAAGSGLSYLLTALAGGVAAALLGWGLYRGSLQLDLRKFFTYSGLILIVFAAGMLANGIKELQEVQAVPALIPHIWDTYSYVSDTTTFGRLLAALLGYDASPSLTQALGYFGYLLTAGGLFMRTLTPPAPKKTEVLA